MEYLSIDLLDESRLAERALVEWSARRVGPDLTRRVGGGFDAPSGGRIWLAERGEDLTRRAGGGADSPSGLPSSSVAPRPCGGARRQSIVYSAVPHRRRLPAESSARGFLGREREAPGSAN